MAKHNYVLLYGQVTRNPTIFKNEQTGEFVRGMCPLTVIRGIRSADINTQQVKYDNPIVMSGNPDQIALMANWRVGDMVVVKGTVTTKNVLKSKSCDHCKEKNHKNGTIVFVSPIYSDVRERNMSLEQGAELLKKNHEVSNIVFVIGNLCNDPQVYQTAKGSLLATYELAISRKFRVQDDTIDSRTDYPWVKSYGMIANADAKALHKGSLVYVDGFLQTRKIEKNHVCEYCGETFKWPDSSMEIVPYSTEYLRNYHTPEEIAKREEEEYKLAVNKIFSEADIIYESANIDNPDEDNN